MSVNVFDFAMQMEKDGETYYRELAAKCNVEGIKNILNLLADDEVGHYNIFKKLKEETPTNIAGTAILANAKNIFAQMREKDKKKEYNFDVSEIELYKKAIEIEKKSEEFYIEKANEIGNPKAKEIFLKIAEDEKRHQFLLENMTNFLSRPITWIEDAEFTTLEDY